MLTKLQKFQILLADVIPEIRHRDKLAFDMSFFKHDENFSKLKDEPFDILKVPEDACGSTCCLAGWAAYHPRFNEEGYRWEARQGKHSMIPEIVYGDHKFTDDSVEKFFELESGEFGVLFTSIFGNTIDDVEKTITGYIRYLQEGSPGDLCKYIGNLHCNATQTVEE